MDQGSTIQSLSDFRKDESDLVARLKRTGEPLLLTVDGKAELVVQDAASYRKLAALAEQAITLDAIRRGLDDMAAGRTDPVDEAFASLCRDLDLPDES